MEKIQKNIVYSCAQYAYANVC